MSVIVYSAIIIPVIPFLSYEIILTALSWSLILILLITAINAFISFFTFYLAINRLGAPVAVAFNSSYILFSIIFSFLFLDQTMTFETVLAGIVVFCGLLVINLGKQSNQISN